MVRTVTTAGNRSSRAAARQALGSLRQLRVLPSTEARYSSAVDAFFADLAANRIRLPARTSAFDDEVASHLNRLWLAGEARTQAGDVISGLQLFVPGLKGHLKAAWSALSTWQRHECPERALPFTDEIAEAMVGEAMRMEDLQLAVALLLGQRGLLRPAEFCALDLSKLVFSADRVVADLGWTKGGARKGVREGAVWCDPQICVLLRYACEEAGYRGKLLPRGYAAFQRSFVQLLQRLGIGTKGFTPYSLRRGGATSLMEREGDLGVLASRGRWANTTTARLYVDSAAAERASIALSAAQKRSVQAARRHFCSVMA